MISDKLKLTAAGAVVALVFVLGAWTGYYLHPAPPVAEVTRPAPAQRQQDGSLIAERAPVLLGEVAAPAPHQLPKGAKEVRRVSATVAPTDPNCAPVRLNMSLVDVEGGLRAVLSSPDGRVVEGMDVPMAVRTAAEAPRRLWAAGPSYSPLSQRYGAFVERDLGRFRLGATLQQAERGDGMEAAIRLGFTF